MCDGFPGIMRGLLSLVEFTFNNSYQSSVSMPPFETLYGQACRSAIYWAEVGKTTILEPDLLQTRSP